MHIHIRIRIRIRLHIIYIYVHIHIYIYIYTYTYTCTYIYVYVQYITLYVYIYICCSTKTGPSGIISQAPAQPGDKHSHDTHARESLPLLEVQGPVRRKPTARLRQNGAWYELFALRLVCPQVGQWNAACFFHLKHD